MSIRVLRVLCAAWACLGMVCVGPDNPSPSLPPARVTGIRLVLEEDPGSGRAAAQLAWSWEGPEPASYFEIYQGPRRDSLGAPIRVQQASEPMEARLRLPDSARPVTLYYGVRAVRVEATGQKVYGDSIPADSLVVTRPLDILSPAPLGFASGRVLEVSVKTGSDAGIVLRQTLYEKSGPDWIRVVDTCLPMAACGIPILGGSVQRDHLVLQGLAEGDTLEALYCVLGDETFEDPATRRVQSLGCNRFSRTGP